MSEEYAKSTDLERLEKQKDNLRLAFIVWTICVSLLSVNAIFQLTPQDLLLPLFAAIGIILLCSVLLINSCTKGSGAPAGT